MRRRGWPLLLCALAPLAAVAQGAAQGDVQRGAALAASRSEGLCVLCHALPGIDARLAGNIGPDLAGVGGRLTPEQLRQRLLAPQTFNPDTVMPRYGRSDGLVQVAASRHGQPLLDGQQIDDVVAYLASLK